MIEFTIEGGWYGGTPEYTIRQGHKVIYGGPTYRLKDCRAWIKKRYPYPKYLISFKRAGGEWHIDIIRVGK